MTFAEALDMAYIIKLDLQMMTKSYILFSMITDSLYLFDILTQASCATEKELIFGL